MTFVRPGDSGDLTGRSPIGGSGVNHAGLRAHNERLVLSLLRQHGTLSKAEITRLTGLSAQTISVINRSLENDHLVQRGDPIRGRVGQPSVPMALDPDGAFSIGLRIGRRSVDLALMDFVGVVRSHIKLKYDYPTPSRILAFVADTLPKLKAVAGEPMNKRIVGIGIGAPFQLYNWLDRLGAPPSQMSVWREFDLVGEIQAITGYETFLVNDGSCACVAEQAVGVGRSIQDFAYFYIGSFIGGGIVINGVVQTGATGNAGAFGPLPSPTPTDKNAQLIDTASLYLLERALSEGGKDPDRIWDNGVDWSNFEPQLSNWLGATAQALASAIVTVCAVVDFPAIVIDGAFPANVRKAITQEISTAMAFTNQDGIIVPQIIEGQAGNEARIIGASMLPISARFATERQASL